MSAEYLIPGNVHPTKKSSYFGASGAVTIMRPHNFLSALEAPLREETRMNKIKIG